MLKKIIISVSLVIILCAIGITLYGWYFSIRIEERFSERRWSIPSKVFSDTTLLYPGQRINRELFHEKLLNLDYRSVSHLPGKKGEMQIAPASIDIYLHDLKTPWQTRQGFPIRMTFDRDRIQAIKRADNGKEIPILELEPEEIMLFFGPERERRQLVSIKEVPEHLIHAVLAAEDSRFFQHHGVDPRGILRAFIANLRHGAIKQGGSTLTQQLAKNYFLTPERTVGRKLKEVLLSVVMEIKYEKNDILEIYLNEIYLGQKGSASINGVGEASYFYFGKSVTELSRAESATLAGLIKAPNHYSPYLDKALCRDRRNDVLRAMHARGWLVEKKLQSDLQDPVNTVGFTVHGKKAPYFIDYLAEQLKGLYRPQVLSSLGLSIFTTIDTQVQMAAEKALTKGLARLEQLNPSLKRSAAAEQLQGAIIVMQPKTGYILAMVGGRSYSISQFNRITQAKRQPGSAFKPLVYLASLDEFKPTSFLSNDSKTYVVDGKDWEPQNFQPVTAFTVTLRDALKMSYNLATVDLAMQIGLGRIVNLTSRFNFSTTIKPYPSLALGAFEVIPLELARAYCVFAADGVQPYPLSLKGVVNENSETLEQKHMEIERLIPPDKAFIMNYMLQSVVTEGTARSLKRKGISWPVAGKTGTTNDFKDAWFVGYTPEILALVWVGFDNGDTISATGSSAALPIWADLINNIPQYISASKFSVPSGVEKRTVCSVTGLLFFENACPHPVEEYFLFKHIPTENCGLHQKSGTKNNIYKGFKEVLNQ
jgi:penicillin-binding protein 1B